MLSHSFFLKERPLTINKGKTYYCEDRCLNKRGKKSDTVLNKTEKAMLV
jgi:hypothetical protein